MQQSCVKQKEKDQLGGVEEYVVAVELDVENIKKSLWQEENFCFFHVSEIGSEFIFFFLCTSGNVDRRNIVL